MTTNVGLLRWRRHLDFLIVMILAPLWTFSPDTFRCCHGFSILRNPIRALKPRKQLDADDAPSSLLSSSSTLQAAMAASTSTTVFQPGPFTSVAVASGVATPLEVWCVAKLERSYTRCLQIRCPFLRRRASDILDAIDSILRFIVIRHKSLDLLPPLGCRATTTTASSSSSKKAAAAAVKAKHLPVEEVHRIIRGDWKLRNNKGYYITGRLNSTIYRDDCLFDGPDPDMPVKGLRKYLNAASQLFDYRDSYAVLQSLRIVDDRTLRATWRMEGVLRLPWRPLLPEWTGTTMYYRDDDGLIYNHIETWDMTVVEAMVKTFLPQLGYRIYGMGERKGDTPLPNAQEEKQKED